MAGRVEGKVALITGGASGIGRSCAERLAQEGAIVVVTDVQDDKGAQTVADIIAAGGKASYLPHDVTGEQPWIDVVAAIKAQHGRLDILVNNAGIGISGSVLTMPLADFQKQTAVNLDGVFLGVKHSIPLMRENGGGSIINMSSVVSLIGAPDLDFYTAAKGAVSALTRSLALQHAPQGIRVNAIAPGATGTERVLKLLQRDGVTNKSLDGQLFGLVPPKDVAYAALFLASDESASTTGHILSVDGGLTIS